MAHIIIAGAGIVGLSVARAARRRGHAVTLLERGPVPNPEAASFDQHRMIRPQYGAAEGYARMTQHAFAAWDRVWADLGARHFVDTGALAISTAPDDYAAQSRVVLERLGMPHFVLTGEALAALCPQLDLPPSSFGVLARPGGPLFADRIVGDLARFCAAEGVRIRAHTPVAAIENGTAVTQDGERITGDFLVVAVGAWLPGLLPHRFGDLPTYRQALCYVAPPTEYRDDWARGPALVVIGDRGVYTLPPVAGTGLKFGSGLHRRPAAPGAGFAAPMEEGREMIADFSPYLRDPGRYLPARMQVGYYVMDATRRFRIEAHRRCVFVTNCDGQMFKFGPLIGERVVAALDGEISAEDLTRWAAGEVALQEKEPV